MAEHSLPDAAHPLAASFPTFGGGGGQRKADYGQLVSEGREETPGAGYQRDYISLILLRIIPKSNSEYQHAYQLFLAAKIR
jgi:hypothetical protein